MGVGVGGSGCVAGVHCALLLFYLSHSVCVCVCVCVCVVLELLGTKLYIKLRWNSELADLPKNAFLIYSPISMAALQYINSCKRDSNTAYNIVVDGM